MNWIYQTLDILKEVVDEGKKDDNWTILIVKEVANSIDCMIKMTTYFPSNYEDAKVPILDMKACNNSEENNEIYYQFYEKNK